MYPMKSANEPLGVHVPKAGNFGVEGAKQDCQQDGIKNFTKLMFTA